MARFARAGFQCATHAIGDRAVAARARRHRAAGARGRGPHRIEHLETLRDAELARLATEGVAASMQPAHVRNRDLPAGEPDSWRDALAPDQAARGFRWADVAASGAILALGSDWPVATADPRVGMAWAQLRRTPAAARTARRSAPARR